MSAGLRITSRPRPLRSQGMIDDLAKGLKNFVEKDVASDFKKTIRTWRHKPRFSFIHKRSTGILSSRIETDDPIYRFVSGGTRVRYATMTPNFSPKTLPLRIDSRAGRGGVLFISRRRPRPGIRARQFDKAIYDKWKNRTPDFIRLVRPY